VGLRNADQAAYYMVEDEKSGFRSRANQGTRKKRVGCLDDKIKPQRKKQHGRMNSQGLRDKTCTPWGEPLTKAKRGEEQWGSCEFAEETSSGGDFARLSLKQRRVKKE